MTTPEFDLVAIGSGPAGFHAAITAAETGRHVALVEQAQHLGGSSILTGTIPSKTLREAVLPLTGGRRRLLVEEGYLRPQRVTMSQLRQHCQTVIGEARATIVEHIQRHNVQLLLGAASFAGPHELAVDPQTTGHTTNVTAGAVVIGTGSVPRRPPGVPFDGRRVIDSDGILALEAVPGSLAIVGAGVIGCEYASIFASLGVRVSLIDRHPTILPFADEQIASALLEHLQAERAIDLHLGDAIEAVETEAGGAVVRLADAGEVSVECVLYCLGRVGATAGLHLEAVGLAPADEDGHLKVDQSLRTAVPWIFAAGDVIGFPGLAATSMEQGRVAARRAMNLDADPVPPAFPYGVYTIPEIGMVGQTEQALRAAGARYLVGRADYREVARGDIIGDRTGFLKLLFEPETRKILGVHIIGEGATELVHLGQSVMNLGGTLGYLRDAVFNYPTLAEAYKVAALDGFRKLGAA